MVEHSSIKRDFHETPNMYPNLNVVPLNENISNDQQFRLNKINEIKDYFIAEIRERELMSKNLSKYIASFDYLDKSLIVLSVATGRISIASFCNCYWSTCRNYECKLQSCIFNYYRVCKKVLQSNKK